MRTKLHATFLIVFLRTYLVAAAFNMRGLQNVGFIYAMDPGLVAIHRDPTELRKARQRYARNYNCHPYWTPFVAGMLLHMEGEIAKGRMSSSAFGPIKDAAVNTLSALGDSVFGGTLLVTWALAMSAMIIGDYAGTALVVSIALFLALQIFKFTSFVVGVRYGFPVLFQLRRLDLINWGDRLKIINALLLVFLLALCVPGKDSPTIWALTVLCVTLAAWATARLYIPRTLLALTGAIVILFLA